MWSGSRIKEKFQNADWRPLATLVAEWHFSPRQSINSRSHSVLAVESRNAVLDDRGDFFNRQPAGELMMPEEEASCRTGFKVVE